MSWLLFQRGRSRAKALSSISDDFTGLPTWVSRDPVGFAIQKSLARVMVRDGLKNAVDHFGVALSTYSQWLRDPSRFGAMHVRALMSADAVFAREWDALMRRMEVA